MPRRVTTLPAFLEEIARLLELCDRCQVVLFRAGFREHLSPAVKEAAGRLREASEHAYLRHPGEYDAMRAAGLVGAQLALKLESFESALTAFEADAGAEQLAEALDKGGTVLSSLAGAIPGFGSFAQELVDFILKELRRRFWRRA